MEVAALLDVVRTTFFPFFCSVRVQNSNLKRFALVPLLTCFLSGPNCPSSRHGAAGFLQKQRPINDSFAFAWGRKWTVIPPEYNLTRPFFEAPGSQLGLLVLETVSPFFERSQ